MKTKSNASLILGIIGIVTALISPIVGFTLGIIGLSVKKDKYGRDIALNTIAIVLALLTWLISMLVMLGF